MNTSHTPMAPNGRHGRVAAPLHRPFARRIPAQPLFSPEELRRLVAEMID